MNRAALTSGSKKYAAWAWAANLSPARMMKNATKSFSASARTRRATKASAQTVMKALTSAQPRRLAIGKLAGDSPNSCAKRGPMSNSLMSVNPAATAATRDHGNADVVVMISSFHDVE